MGELPSYEQTFDTLTNGVRHDKHMWFDPNTLRDASHFLDKPHRWGILLVSAEQQLGKSGAYQWRRGVEGAGEAESRRAGAADDPLAGFQFQTATALHLEQLPPLNEIVEGFLHEGLWLFGGKSKRGKSWLMLDMALAIAAGRAAFGHFGCAQMPVLYLAFEDAKRRIKDRMTTIEPQFQTRDLLHFVYTFPRLGAGAVEMLDAALSKYGYGAVIVDVLAHLRQTPARGKGGESYQEIYDELMAMQELVKRHHAAIILIDHLRKQAAEDIFEMIQGSVAKQGAADALMVLDRKADSDEVYLHVRSKEIGDHIHALIFDRTHFEYVGEGEAYKMKQLKRDILKVFREERRYLAINDILREMREETSAAYQRTRRAILGLEEEGYLSRRETNNTVKWVATTLRERADYDDSDVPF